MGNSTQSTGKKLDGFLSKKAELVDTLPSQETKSRLDKELAVLIEFLTDFRNRLKTLPTDQDANDVTSTIEMIKDYVRVAESDPMLSRVLGLSENGTLRKSPQTPYGTESQGSREHGGSLKGSLA